MVDHEQREPLIKSQVANGQTLRGSPTTELAFGASLAQSLENAQSQIDRRKVESDLKLGLTPVRRTFCLLSIFDALLVFLLWIIYAQVNQLMFGYGSRLKLGMNFILSTPDLN